MRDFHADYDDIDMPIAPPRRRVRKTRRRQCTREERYLAELEYELELEYQLEREYERELRLEREAILREELWLEERIYRACLAEMDRPRRLRRTVPTYRMPQYDAYESRYWRKSA